MSNESSPRSAIVIGASGGIGQAIAERLAADGVQVLVHYSSSKSKAEKVANSIVEKGGKAVIGSGEVSDLAQMEELFQLANDTFDGVDVVVNTAGIMPLAPISQMSLETFDRIFQINVRGSFIINQLAAQRVSQGGAIINFSTSITKLQFPNYGAYAASKGAVEAMTLTLARELQGKDITVNTIAPGPTATPLFFEGKSEQVIENIAKLSPMHRLGTPEDIAEVAAFLAGPGRWINGQIIYANGGAI